jgi:hypothetical protein
MHGVLKPRRKLIMILHDSLKRSLSSIKNYHADGNVEITGRDLRERASPPTARRIGHHRAAS